MNTSTSSTPTSSTSNMKYHLLNLAAIASIVIAGGTAMQHLLQDNNIYLIKSSFTSKTRIAPTIPPQAQVLIVLPRRRLEICVKIVRTMLLPLPPLSLNKKHSKSHPSSEDPSLNCTPTHRTLPYPPLSSKHPPPKNTLSKIQSPTKLSPPSPPNSSTPINHTPTIPVPPATLAWMTLPST